jgi:hypothetical protein
MTNHPERRLWARGIGPLIIFNVTVLKDGVRRFIVGPGISFNTEGPEKTLRKKENSGVDA